MGNSALNIALDICLNNQEEPSKLKMLLTMVMALGFSSIPYLVKWYFKSTAGKDMFKSEFELVHAVSFSLVLTPMYLTNLILVLALGNFYFQKKKQKQAVLQMLDAKYKYRYNLSADEKANKAVPLIVKHSAFNQL